MSINSSAVQNSVAELIRIIQRTPEVPTSEVQRATRLLRPASSTLSEHVPAMKHRLREEVLKHAHVSSTNGPAAVAEFDRLLDDLQHMNPGLVPAILSVLEPLAFQKHLSKIAPVSYLAPSRTDSQRHVATSAASEADRPRRFIPVAQPHLVGEEAVQNFRSEVLWMSPETEEKLLRDLLYIFQVEEYIPLSISSNIKYICEL